MTPILTKMTREIDLREKELTHQIHRELLCQHLEQVKNLTPSFISTIKIFLLVKNGLDADSTRGENSVSVCIDQSKEFLIRRLSDEINEMIRILQLTTYDEDESDDLTIMKQKLSSYEAKIRPALDWLADPNALCGGSGEKLFRNALEDANTIANKLESDHSEPIQYSINSLRNVFNDFCILTKEGKVK